MFSDDTVIRWGACLVSLALIPTALIVPLPGSAPPSVPHRPPGLTVASACGAPGPAGVGLIQHLPPGAAPDLPSPFMQPSHAAVVTASADPIAAAPPATQPLTVFPQYLSELGPAEAVALQSALRERGLYRGSLDGALGPRTVAALLQFATAHCQEQRQAIQDGRVSPALWRELMPSRPH